MVNSSAPPTSRIWSAERLSWAPAGDASTEPVAVEALVTPALPRAVSHSATFRFRRYQGLRHLGRELMKGQSTGWVRCSASAASRSSDSVFRRMRIAFTAGLCGRLPGPAIGISCIVTRQPSSSSSSSRTTRGSPNGHPRAVRTGRTDVWTSATTVSSRVTRGTDLRRGIAATRSHLRGRSWRRVRRLADWARVLGCKTDELESAGELLRDWS